LYDRRCSIDSKDIEQVISDSSCSGEHEKSRVIPVFKSDNRADPNNYRPISVIPLVPKIMEKIVFKRFTKQYGFVSGSSTECALFDLIPDI
jgi:hypothetical protein